MPLWVKLAVGASLIAVVPALAIGAWAMQVNAEALSPTRASCSSPSPTISRSASSSTSRQRSAASARRASAR